MWSCGFSLPAEPGERRRQQGMEAIVAVYSDWGIGSDGTQPIVISEDRKRFAALTRGAAVIYGRRTMDDFPSGAPLEGRVNILISRNGETPGATVVRSPEEAVEEAEKYERCFAVGGASIYMALFPHLTRIYVTKIDAAPHSDAFFPNLDSLPEWKCVEEEPYEEGGVSCRFCIYERTGCAGA